MYAVLLFVCSPFNLLKINPSRDFGETCVYYFYIFLFNLYVWQWLAATDDDDGAETGFLLSGLKTYNYGFYSFGLCCFVFLFVYIFISYFIVCTIVRFVVSLSFILAFSFNICLFYM